MIKAHITDDIKRKSFGKRKKKKKVLPRFSTGPLSLPLFTFKKMLEHAAFLMLAGEKSLSNIFSSSLKIMEDKKVRSTDSSDVFFPV